MEQTTSLHTAINTSTLRWKIASFLDYSYCCIEKVKSTETFFANKDVSWFLEVFPGQDRVKLFLKINDNEPVKNRLFRAEISVDGDGQHLNTSANRHLVTERGFFAEPEVVEPPKWNFKYQKNNEAEFEKFWPTKDVEKFLNGGTLALNISVRQFDRFIK